MEHLNYNRDSVSLFYGRLNNVLLPTLASINDALICLNKIDKLISLVVIDKFSFLSTMKLVNELKQNFLKFTPVYDLDNTLIDVIKSYDRKPLEAIDATEIFYNELILDKELYKEGLVEETQDLLNKLKNDDIFNHLTKLESMLNPENYVSQDDKDTIVYTKHILYIYNNSEEDEKIKELTNFARRLLEANTGLDSLYNLYSEHEGIIEQIYELEMEIPWISEWFSSEELKPLAAYNSTLYFNTLKIINLVKDYSKEEITPESTTNLIEKLRTLNKIGEQFCR